MREKYIIDYQIGDNISNFFVIDVSGSIDLKKNNAPYGKLVISDKTGSLDCRYWDIKNTEEELNKFKNLTAGTIIKVIGEIKLNSYNGEDNLQLIIKEYSLPSKDDKIDESDLYKVSPIDPEIVYNRIIEIINTQIEDESYKTICNKIYDSYKEKLINWPAAQIKHHNYKGGLLWHTYRMLLMAINATNVYTNINKSLLLAGTALHDIGKLYEFDINKCGKVEDYTLEGKMLGHLMLGTMTIINTIKSNKIEISKEKKLLLEHMITAHHGKLEWETIKKPEIIEAYILHMLDKLDADLEQIQTSLEKVDNNRFATNKSINDTKFYKPTFYDE